MRSNFTRLLSAGLILSLAGCAATVKQTPTSAASSVPPSSRVQAPTGTLVAVLQGSSAMRNSEDWEAFVEEWQESLATASSEAKVPFVFASNGDKLPQNASVLLRLTVKDFKYVSTTKRYLMGIIAGDASMDVDAQYIELPSNRPFGSKTFNTTSSAWQGIFSAVTPKQVQTVSEIILKDITSTAPSK